MSKKRGVKRKKRGVKRAKGFGLKDYQALKRAPYGSARHQRATKALWDWLKS